MSGATGLLVAIVFVWLGMVLAISFLEAPLKFRAPDVTVRIGLGIGRLVFRALNTVEAVFALVIVATITFARPETGPAIAIPILVLVTQLALVRPRLTRRTDLVLAGQDPPRSRSHHAYVALETLKVGSLAVAGMLLLTN